MIMERRTLDDRSEDSYKPGDEVFYHEDGAILKKRVLENNSDSQWIRYKF